ncbi:probable methyltransferase PMT26 [Brassica rapa]|uniref:probable methyltransferase PMT26 n=1 Tax=Brassica campestris TaxID=3711 RepID=UPI0004F17D0B|nr:probable methyltransferase PMT26 [Brassica rapa]XP_009130434.1 probable methyltransferase PMT26 [Brassica rapa]
MAQPRYTRIDNTRRPASSYCSTVTIVVFVALCLVGIWMMTSSSLGPDQSVDVVPLDNKDGIKNQMTPPEDAAGETPKEEKKGDGDESSSKEEKTKEESTSSGETKSETEGLKDNPEEENPDSNEKQTKPETEDNESGEDGENQKKFEADGIEKKSSDDETGNEGAETKPEKENSKTNVEQESQPKNETSGGAQLELVNETIAQNGSFSTQATESKKEKEAQKSSGDQIDFKWKVCNTTAGPDYIPCLDNVQAIRSLKSTKHYEHRERHCPDSPPTCLVPLPEGYKRPIEWPKSREKIWYTNVPHTKLAEYKGHQNWVKVTGEYLTFPGGGTQFKHGALHYIDFIQESVSDIAWGKRSRVVLDVGCGVASFGGFLFDRDVITMSLAPKDEHEAQVQFALERGIPAISAVMGTTRLPFPGRVFDIVHCARCRVPWHIEGGKLLLELNRVLRPGGFFVWSATPVYQKKTEDVGIWKAMSELTKKMCWELISINKDKINGIGVATYKKPTSNECYTSRSEQNPPICAESDDPNASWKVPLQACMHTAPEDKTQRGSQWPEQWPARLDKPPYWLSSSQTGVYGKAAPEDFSADYEHWKRVVTKSYLKGLGINWGTVRNVMDMKAVYGGFAAALREMKVWVMNVVPIDSPDTLAIIYERGLFGIYHDWCESFSTYPRSYDLLHADHLFSKLKQRCNLTAVVAEVDRVLRPEGKLIVRDDAETIQEVEAMVKAMKWEVRMTYSKEKEGLLSVQKSIWRPEEVETLTYAIAT